MSGKRADDNTFDITSVLEKTILGLKARPEFQRELMASYSPVGKLIRPIRDEDVAERDGEHGRPLWITLGQDVFNITGTSSVNRYAHDILPLVTDPSPEAFPFESMHQRIMLRSNPGANPMHAIDEDDSITAEQVVEYLWPYRCATLAGPRPVQGPKASSENLYTRKEVAWHTYRETGMYTIIRDNVYDMTGRLPAFLFCDLAPAERFCIDDNRICGISSRWHHTGRTICG